MRTLKVGDVCQKTSLSRATIYRLVKGGKFPKPVRLTERTSRWPEKAIDDWIAARMAGASAEG